MSSHPEPQSERKPTPAYVRVFRSHIRNISSPTVWAPMAIIALLLALSADYWNSLRVLNEDIDPSLISENVSQLAESVSETSSIAASEIDSSDVLSDLLSQAELPVMADDNSIKAAEEQVKRLNLENVDLLGLPNLNQGKNSDKNGNQAKGNEAADTATPNRRLSLLDALSGNYSTGTSATSSTGSTANRATSPATSLDPTLDATNSPDSSVGTTRRTGGMGGSGAVNTSAAVNGFNRSSQTSTFVDRETEPAVSLTQLNGSRPSFTGYAYGGSTAPSATGLTTAPVFTGYPTSSAVSVPATPYTGGYTGYATSPYVAPSAGTSAPNTYNSPYSSNTPYGNVQYGSQPSALTTPTGMNAAPIGSPQTGYAIGTPSSTAIESPATTYSVPRSTPGRYIGNGEINTFADP